MQTIEILGVPASPYTRKMLALLRYRRIPYRVLWGSHIAPTGRLPGAQGQFAANDLFANRCRT